jgi:hypothetical protein
MANILGLCVVVLVSGAGLSALLATLELLLSGPVERCRTVLAGSLGRLFLLGLVNFVFFFVLAILLARLTEAVIPAFKAVLGVLAVLILAGLVVLATLGLAGLVKLLRERIGLAATVWGTLRAAALLLIAALTPALGWWVFTPAVLVTCLGAGIVVAVRRPSTLPASPLPSA